MTTGFNWHDQPEGFLKWMLVHLMPHHDLPDYNAKWEEISTATDKSRNVIFTIQINGIEVDAMQFVEALERSMDWAVAKEAERILRESTSFDQLQIILSGVERSVKALLRNELQQVGIELQDEENW